MVPFDRTIDVFYRLSIVTISLSLITIRPKFATECLRRSVTLGQNLGKKGLTDVSQILTRSGRDMGLSYAKAIMSMFSVI